MGSGYGPWAAENKKIEDGDSYVLVTDPGTGEISMVVDGTTVQTWTASGGSELPGPIVIGDTTYGDGFITDTGPFEINTDGDFTINVDSGLAFKVYEKSPGYRYTWAAIGYEAGTQDVQAGFMALYGHASGFGGAGGQIGLYTAQGQTEIAYVIQPVGDNLYIGPSGDQDALTYNRSLSRFEFTGSAGLGITGGKLRANYGIDLRHDGVSDDVYFTSDWGGFNMGCADGWEVNMWGATGAGYYDFDGTTNFRVGSHGVIIRILNSGAVDLNYRNAVVLRTYSGKVAMDAFQLGGNAESPSGPVIDTIETTLTDDDTHLPTSGAVFDAIGSGALSNISDVSGGVGITDGTNTLSIKFDTDTWKIDNFNNHYFEFIGNMFGVKTAARLNAAGKQELYYAGSKVFETTSNGIDTDGLQFNTGQLVDTIETALTDDDTHLPTSGAVVDAIAAGGGHARLHSMTDVLDHSATNWRVFYSDGSGQVAELALGAANTVLISNGASVAPSFGQLAHSNLNLDDGTNPHGTTLGDVGAAPASHGNAAHSSTFITASDVTRSNLNANGDVGTGAAQVAAGDHSHSGYSTVSSQTLVASFCDQNNPFVTSSSTIGWTVKAYILFPGTTNWKTPTAIDLLAWRTSGTNSIGFRIEDVTNANVICSITGITDAVPTQQDMGTLSNLSAGEAVWEIQVLPAGNPGVGAIAAIHIH